MYFDPNELVAEREADPAERRRVQRDLFGLALLIAGAAFTIAAASLAHPGAGLALSGIYLMAAGWLLASGRAN
ncbi:hypothetical protein [Planomonospora algeriensis]